MSIKMTQFLIKFWNFCSSSRNKHKPNLESVFALGTINVFDSPWNERLISKIYEWLDPF